MDFSKAVKAYTNLRAARADVRKGFDARDGELKAAQEKIEMYLLNYLNENSMASVKTDNGTFYRQEEIKPSCQDWSAFYAWIKENDAFDALEKRVTKTFVKSYMDDNDGTPPPGVSVYRENVVRVRRNP